MNSRHWWPAPLPLGTDLLAVVCAACHRPLIPMPSPDDWQRRVREFASRDDCPGNGLGRIEGQNQAEDQTRDPDDTMPAQGWATAGLFDLMDLAQAPDAGRLPAPRKDTPMASLNSERGTLLVAEVADELRPFPETDDRYGYDQATIDRWADASGTEEFVQAASHLTVSALSRLVKLCDEVAEEHERRAHRAERVREELRELTTAAVGIHSARVQSEQAGGIRG